MISRMVGTPVFSDRTEFSVTTVDLSVDIVVNQGRLVSDDKFHERSLSKAPIPFPRWKQDGVSRSIGHDPGCINCSGIPAITQERTRRAKRAIQALVEVIECCGFHGLAHGLAF